MKFTDSFELVLADNNVPEESFSPKFTSVQIVNEAEPVKTESDFYYSTLRPRKKETHKSIFFLPKTVMIYQKKFTLLQNSIYPLSFDISYKM